MVCRSGTCAGRQYRLVHEVGGGIGSLGKATVTVGRGVLQFSQSTLVLKKLFLG